MESTTSTTALRAEVINDLLRDLRIAPPSWRMRNVAEMTDEVFAGWRAFGVLTDIPAPADRVLDMDVHPLTGTLAEQLGDALAIGARIAGHRMETAFAGTGGARMRYADELVMLLARYTIARGVFFLTAAQVETIATRDLDVRWR